MEAFWYDRELNFLESLVRISGFEVLKEAYEAREGVLLFSGHIGSTGLFFAVTGKMGIKMNIIGRSIDPGENPLHPAALTYNKNRVRWIEEAVGNPFLLTGRGSYPVMREKLDKGEVLLMLIDVVPLFVRRTLTVTFFRRPAAFPYGIASLYRQTRARLLQWTIHRNDEVGRQEIEIQDVTEQVDRSRNETEIVQRLVGLLQEKIRLYPGHWLLWDSLEHFYTAVQASNSRELSLLTVE